MSQINRSLEIKKRTRRYSPERGVYEVIEYNGTLGQIRSLAAQLYLSRPDITWEEVAIDPPLYGLNVSTPEVNGITQEPTDVTWEIGGEQVTKSLYQHPKALEVRDVNVPAFDAALDIEKENLTGAEYTEAYDALVLESPQMAQIAQHVHDDQKSFFDVDYVARKVQVVGYSAPITVGFSNVLRLHTTAQLLASEPTLAGAALFSVSAIPAKANKAGYAWTWLKMPPQVQASGSSKATIAQVYLLALWSTFIYDPV